MFKTLTFLKRRDGMSFEDFRLYYENKHAPLGMQLILPEARRYVRRYINPQYVPTPTGGSGIDFDVVTEIWFDDRAAFDRMIGRLSQPKIAALIAEDEEKLFDRSRNRLVIVDEEETMIGDIAVSI